MSEEKNVPKLRFPGFTEPWEQRKLGEVATFINGRAYSQDELLDEGKYKVLRVGNFYTNDSWYYSDLELPDKFYAQEGDLLYTWSATFGPHIWHGNKVIYHYHIWKVELSDKLDKTFTLQLLEEDKANILANKNGSTMVHITKEGMEQKQISIPSSVQEQAQIGAYFEQLDNLITLHQRKLGHVKDLKKSMLQKMFPKNGELYPEVRFPGFTAAWEQRKLGEYVSITSGEAPSKFEVGTELYVKVDDLNYNDKYVVDTQNKVAEHSTVKRVTKGSVVFPKRGAAIMTNKVRIMGIDGYMDTNMMALTSEKLDSEFLYNIISKEGLYKIADTSTIPQINNKHVEPYEVTIPSLDEQRKIGAYFKQLDHLITLHQRELDHLQLLKKGMLQQMFV